MNIKYFNETDTAHLQFSDLEVKETIELSENIYLDIDNKGNPVSMTLEHASLTAQLPNLSIQQMGKATA